MSASRKRVLVVDDEAIVRICCERSASPDEFEIITVEDAAEGLRLLKSETFDIILTDLKMPGMDGIEFIYQSRKFAPETSIVLISGYDTEDVREQSERLGVHYLPKPFGPNALIEALRNAGG